MQKSHKIDVTPMAHRAAKIHCADKGINIKDYVSSLILQSVGNKIIRFIDEIPDTSFGASPEDKSLLSNSLPNPNSQLLVSPKEMEYPNFNEPGKICIPSYETQNTSWTNLEDKPPSVNSLSNNQLNSRNSLNPKIERPILNNPQKSDVFSDDLGVDNGTVSKLDCDIQSRASIIACQIYDLISADPNKAQTPEEIAKALPDINRSAAQKALYWLLRKGAVQRKLREFPEDRRKNSWEYWKLDSNIILKKKGIDTDKVLELLPENTEQALSVREIASKLDVPLSTTRDALNQLELEGMIGSLHKPNSKNQTITWYYRAYSKHPIEEIKKPSRFKPSSYH